MWKLRIVFVLATVLSCVNNSAQRSTEESPNYVAAVVEFSPYFQNDADALTIYEENVGNYVGLITTAADETNKADIIVFPEAGLVTLGRSLYTQIPSPEDKLTPCTDEVTSRFENLRKLSCAAQQHQIYVVVNLSEMVPCPNGTLSEYDEPCPASGEIYYNTNVAFDRNGVVVARYRKFHLFGEDPVVPPPVADLVWFTTDFGVSFGMFTCFDLMFDVPTIKLVEHGITDLIFPTAWFSELPFLSAIQAQAAWAYGMDVNFLTAGYNQPLGGSAGSGIYAGRNGPLSYVMPSEAHTELLVRTVPKKIFAGPHDKVPEMQTPTINPTPSSIYMKVDDLSAYITRPIDADSMGVSRLCHNTFCCDFDVQAKLITDAPTYHYRTVAFDGVRTFTGVATGGVQICGVIACTDTDQASCGHLFTTEQVPLTAFTKIKISGTFNKNNAMQFPNTLIDDYYIIPADDFTFSRVNNANADDKVDFEMELKTETSLMTFAIFGREFTRDGDEVTPPIDAVQSTTLAEQKTTPDTASSVHVSFINIVILLLFLNYFK